MLRGKSLRWIKIPKSTNKIFEILIRIWSFPKRKRLSGLLLAETSLNNLEDLVPGDFVAKIPQKPIQSVFVREVRDLAFDNNGQFIHTLSELGFADSEDYELDHGVDALRE